MADSVLRRCSGSKISVCKGQVWSATVWKETVPPGKRLWQRTEGVNSLSRQSHSLSVCYKHTHSVAECVQHFITAMDSLKLNMVAVDQVHPPLNYILTALSRVPQLSPDFEGNMKMRDWISRLNKMTADDELTDQQARQLIFDLETSYNSFINALPKSS